MPQTLLCCMKQVLALFPPSVIQHGNERQCRRRGSCSVRPAKHASIQVESDVIGELRRLTAVAKYDSLIIAFLLPDVLEN